MMMPTPTYLVSLPNIQLYVSNVVSQIRDGSDEQTIDPNNPDDFRRGQHEPVSFYSECAARERNRGTTFRPIKTLSVAIYNFEFSLYFLIISLYLIIIVYGFRFLVFLI